MSCSTWLLMSTEKLGRFHNVVVLLLALPQYGCLAGMALKPRYRLCISHACLDHLCLQNVGYALLMAWLCVQEQGEMAGTREMAPAVAMI